MPRQDPVRAAPRAVFIAWGGFLAGGASAGFYAYGWTGLLASDYARVGLAGRPGTLVLSLSLGIAAVCLLGELLRRVLQRWFGLDAVAAYRRAAWLQVPLLGLGLGVLIFPLFQALGAGLHLDLLGRVRLPWQAAFIHLPPPAYLYLLWAGPWLTLPVFLASTTGLVKFLSRLSSAETGPERARPRAGVLIVSALVFYAGLSLWTTTVYPPTGDEPHYLLMTQSLLQDHDLDLRNNMRAREYRRFYPGETLDFHGAPAKGPGLVSKHFPLLSWLLLPGYALFGRLGASWLISLAAALIAWGIYRLALSLFGSPTAALCAWGAVLLSPPLAVYFDLIYTELPASLVLVCGAWAWLRGGRRGILLAALAAAILPWFYPKYLPLALWLGILLPWSRNANLRDLLFAGGLILVSAAAYYGFFQAHYAYGLAGNPFGEFHSLWSRPAGVNALGLWVDRDFGLLATAPVLLVALAGFSRRTPDTSRFLAVASGALAVQVLLYAGFDDFTGSSAIFSRNILPGTLLLFVLVPSGWVRLGHLGQAGKILRSLALGLSILISWLCAACPLLLYLSPKIQLWRKLGFAPYVFPSLALAPTRNNVLWGGAWMLLFGLILFWAYRRRPPAPR